LGWLFVTGTLQSHSESEPDTVVRGMGSTGIVKYFQPFVLLSG